MKRIKKNNDNVVLRAVNNCNFIKGEGIIASSKKYKIQYFDTKYNAWCDTGKYVSTLREFHEEF